MGKLTYLLSFSYCKKYDIQWIASTYNNVITRLQRNIHRKSFIWTLFPQQITSTLPKLQQVHTYIAKESQSSRDIY